MNPLSRNLGRRTFVVGALGGSVVATLSACDSERPKLGPSSPSASANSTSSSIVGAADLRAQAKNVRPTDFVKTYEVDSSGKSGAYKTLTEACKAVLEDQKKQLGTAVMVQAQSNPWQRRQIRVAPGTYKEENIPLPNFVAVVGTGERPEDVHVVSAGASNVLATTARSAYVSNVHLEHTSADPEWHPLRDGGTSGDVGMGPLQRRTVIFDKVKFTSARAGLAGKCATDIVLAPGSALVFVNCTFNTPGQPQAVNCPMNLGTNGDASAQAVFIDCHTVSNYEQHYDPTVPHGGVGPAAPIGAPDFGAKRGDEFVWLGGTWDVAKTRGVQGLLVIPFVGKGADKSSNAKYFIESAGAENGVRTILADKAKHVSHGVKGASPLPVQGMSRREQAFFGSKPPTAAKVMKADRLTGQLEVKQGDIYWIAIDLKGQALAAKAVGLDGFAGEIAASIALDKAGRPESDPNGATSSPAAKTQQDSVAVPVRWFYPGQGRVWVAVAFTRDVTVPAITARKASAYRDNGYTSGPIKALPDAAKPLPAGTLVPAVTVMNQLPESFDK